MFDPDITKSDFGQSVATVDQKEADADRKRDVGRIQSIKVSMKACDLRSTGKEPGRSLVQVRHTQRAQVWCDNGLEASWQMRAKVEKSRDHSQINMLQICAFGENALQERNDDPARTELGSAIRFRGKAT